MSHREGDKIYFYDEAPQQCDFCNKIAELRPYGPNGECICFPCGMKDKRSAIKMLSKSLLGVNLTDSQAEMMQNS